MAPGGDEGIVQRGILLPEGRGREDETEVTLKELVKFGNVRLGLPGGDVTADAAYDTADASEDSFPLRGLESRR